MEITQDKQTPPLTPTLAMEKKWRRHCRGGQSNHERGSILLYILVAVVLLAALSYAVSRGSRDGISTFTDQQAKLAANEIIEYGNTVATAVQKLRLRGCKDTEISFENSISATNYVNPNAPTDKSCHVFDLAGGNIQWNTSETLKYGPYFMGIADITDIGEAGISELILFAEVEKSVCEKINILLNGAETPEYDHIAYVAYPSAFDGAKFKGVYSDGVGVIAETTSWRAGKTSGCIFRDDYDIGAGVLDEYQYYHTLIVR